MTSPRHARLAALRDRFITANLRSRAIRLTRTTRSGAFDLSRLAACAPAAWERLLAGLGRIDVDVDLIDVNAADVATEARGAAHRAAVDDLTALLRAARADDEVSGAHDLAVGWPFVEGRSADGTWVRGPLLLYGATLDLAATGKRRFTLAVSRAPWLNAPLLQTLDRIAGVRVSFDDLVAGDDDATFAVDDATFAGLHATLARLGLPLSALPPLLPTPLGARAAVGREALPLGRFALSSSVVLGRFPRVGSTIANDYARLLETALHDSDLGAAAELLGVDDAAPSPSSPADATTTTTTTTTTTGRGLGSRRFQVLPSDQSQDAVFAFLDAPTADALVVQGPPGTGKSQLLTNLVVAAVARGERVLVVCQKRAALDVVADRLDKVGFGRPLALVHDVELDRARVAERVAQALQALQQLPTSTSTTTSSSSTAAAATAERDERLAASDRAWQAMMTSTHTDRPAPAVLVERALGHATRLARADWRDVDVDLSDVVDAGGVSGDAPGDGAVRALARRAELLAPRALPLASPHALSQRGDFSATGLDAIARACALVRDRCAVVSGMRTPLATALAVKDTVAALEPTLRVLAGGVDVDDERSAFLLFAGWTDGDDAGGVWKKTVKALERAKKARSDVPRGLYGQSAATLARFATDLAALVELDTRWWRFFTPRYWRLKKVVDDVHAAALTLTPSATTSTSPTARRDAALALVRETLAWHAFAASLPDHDVLPLGVDGTRESLDNALAGLKRWHQHLTALHAAHRALAARRDVDDAFHAAVDVAAADGFVDALLNARAQLRALADVDAATSAARAFVDPRALDAAVRAKDAGDVGPLAALTGALAGAADSVDGAAAAALDREAADDPALLRAFLRRVPTTTPARDLATVFAAAVEAAWLKQACAGRDPLLVSAPLVDDTALAQLASAHSRCLRAAADTALTGVDDALRARLADKSGGRALKRLLVEVQKKRRVPSLRALTDGFWGQGLDAVLPVWLCSPESAAALFPMQPGLFDLVIFDESSQCPVESAVPALVRGKRAVIAGDDQQMPPSHFFQASASNDDDDDDSAVLASASVLELARAAFPSTTLAWHYRSRDERLIAFSNAAFYGGRLTTAPTPLSTTHDAPGADGLFFTRVPGVWAKQHNAVEAAAVVERVVALLSLPAPPSVGVIAFNQVHAEHIEGLLDERVANDAAARAAWQAMRARPPTERLFVRNLENVQGDERDVIVVSPAYGPTDLATPHIVAARFGPLGQAGGEKRLNVAITRARRALHVFCSFAPDALDVSGSTHVGPKLFRLWLMAVEAAAHNDDAALARILNDAREQGGARGVVDVDLDSGGGDGNGVFVDRLAARLTAAGLRVERGRGLGAQRLSLGVGPAGGAVCVGVDVGFVDERDALARDVYTPSFWRRAGLVIVRVTPFSFFDEDALVARVVAAVGDAQRASATTLTRA